MQCLKENYATVLERMSCKQLDELDMGITDRTLSLTCVSVTPPSC